MKYSLDKDIKQFVDRLLCDAYDCWAVNHFDKPEPEAVKSRRLKALAVLKRLVERLPDDEFRALRRFAKRPTIRNFDFAFAAHHKMIFRGRGRKRAFVSWGDCSLETARIPARQFFEPSR